MGQKSEASVRSVGGFSYTHSYDLKDRILYMDIDYLNNEEGRFKIIEIVSRIFLSFLESYQNPQKSLALIQSRQILS